MSPLLEERYVVIKLKDLTEAQKQALGDTMASSSIPTRDCVVVEVDWPQYEPVVKWVVTGEAPVLETFQ